MKRTDSYFLVFALFCLLAIMVMAPPPDLQVSDKPQILAVQGETYKLPGDKEVQLQGSAVAVKVNNDGSYELFKMNKDGSYELSGMIVDAKKTIIRDGKVEYVGSGTVKVGAVTTDATDTKDVYLDGGKIKGTMNKASSKFAGIAAENSRFTYHADGKPRIELESTRLPEGDAKVRPVVIASLDPAYGGEISGVFQIDDKGRKIKSPVIEGTIEQGLFGGQAQFYFNPAKIQSIDGVNFGQEGNSGLVALGFSGWKPLGNGPYVVFGNPENPSIEGRVAFAMPIAFLPGNSYLRVQERSVVLGLGYSDFSISLNRIGDADINVWPKAGSLFNLVNGERILYQDGLGNIRDDVQPERKTFEGGSFPYAGSVPLSVYYHASAQAYWYRFADGGFIASTLPKTQLPDFSQITIKPRLKID